VERVLAYFAAIPSCENYLIKVLDGIDSANLMPPLAVIQILCRFSNVPLSVIKEFIAKRLQQQNLRIAEDVQLIKIGEDEKVKMRQEIMELKMGARYFQSTKCNACMNPLENEFPTIHFLCMHSFHQRCLGDTDSDEVECPICAPNNHKIMDIVKANEEGANQHDKFSRQLEEEGNNGFATVAEYFGRGVFLRPNTENARQQLLKK